MKTFIRIAVSDDEEAWETCKTKILKQKKKLNANKKVIIKNNNINEEEIDL